MGGEPQPRVRKRLRRRATAGAALVLLGSAPQPAAAEDALCVEAMAKAGGEALAALAAAEQAEWRVIRHARREIRALARGTQGLGESQHSLRSIERMDELYRTIDAAMQRARTLCFCRQDRGDPHREDCARLYDGGRGRGREL